MATPSGRWVAVPLPGGGVRQDWVPAEQPPPQDGQPGQWHIVNDPQGGESRWEWHATVAPVPPRAGATAGSYGTGSPPGGRPPIGWDPRGLPGARDPRWNPWRAAARPFIVALAILTAVGVVTFLIVTFVGLHYYSESQGDTGSSSSGDYDVGSAGTGSGGPWWTELVAVVVGFGTFAAAVFVLIGTLRFAVLAWRITEPVT